MTTDQRYLRMDTWTVGARSDDVATVDSRSHVRRLLPNLIFHVAGAAANGRRRAASGAAAARTVSLCSAGHHSAFNSQSLINETRRNLTANMKRRTRFDSCHFARQLNPQI